MNKNKYYKKLVEPHIYETNWYWHDNKKFIYENNERSYVVRYANTYFTITRKFNTLEEAKMFKEICEKQLLNIKFEKSLKQIKRSTNGNSEYLEYPENILKVLGITPDNYENYYDEIVPTFDERVKQFLNEKELFVINKRFKEKQTLEQIGNILGVTRERIRQIENKAIGKLSSKRYIREIIKDSVKNELIEKEKNDKLYNEIKEKMTYEIALQIVGEQMSYEKALEIVNKKCEGISIANIGFSCRTVNCLQRANIFTLDELLTHSEEDLLKIRNFGRKCIEEVNDFLLKSKLRLKGNK